MLSQEDEKKLRDQLKELGIDEMKKKLRMNHYGSYSSPKYKFVQHIIEEMENADNAKYAEITLDIQREANEIAKEANLKADEANEISKSARNIAIVSAIFAAIAIIVTILLAFYKT